MAGAPAPPGPSPCRETPPKTGSRTEFKCGNWKIFDQNCFHLPLVPSHVASISQCVCLETMNQIWFLHWVFVTRAVFNHDRSCNFKTYLSSYCFRLVRLWIRSRAQVFLLLPYLGLKLKTLKSLHGRPSIKPTVTLVIHRLLGSLAAAKFNVLKQSSAPLEKSSKISGDLDGGKISPLSLTVGKLTDSPQLLTSSTQTCSNTLWWSDKRQISQLWNISFIADFWAKCYLLLLSYSFLI